MSVKQSSTRFHKENTRQIEGRNPVREALRADTQIIEISIEHKINRDDRVDEILSLAQQKNIPINRHYPKRMRRMSKTGGHHQGVIAIAEQPNEPGIKLVLETLLAAKKTPNLLIIPEILYEHNLGAILRSAESFGVDAVITSNRGLQISPVVAKTSSGASEHIYLLHENIFTTLKYLHKQGIVIFGLVAGDHKRIYNADFNRPTALVVGAEDSGISEPVEKHIDEFVSIPMVGQVESLNVSVATALTLYEVYRQRK